MASFKYGTAIKILTAWSLVASAAFGAEKKTFELTDPPMQAPAFDAEKFDKEIAHLQEYSKRKIAQVESFEEEKALSEEYRNIRSHLIGGPIFKDGKPSLKDGQAEIAPGIKKPEDIARLLTVLNEKHAGLKNADAKVLSAQIQMIRPFMGFIHRTRNIFEKDQAAEKHSGGRATYAHAMAVTMLRTIVAGIEVYLPDDQWREGFNFVVLPSYAYPNPDCTKTVDGVWVWGPRCDINKGELLQVWLRKEFLPQLGLLHEALSKSSFETPVYWDNQMLLNSNANTRFLDSKDRYLKLGEPERLMMLSIVQATMAGSHAFISYNIYGLFESFDSLAFLYGFQAPFKTTGTTARERFMLIREKHPSLFKYLGTKEAQENMDASYNWLKNSLRSSHAAWQALNKSDTNASRRNVIDPRLAAPFSRIMNMGFQNLFSTTNIPTNKKEVSEGQVISTVIGGEKVVVRLKEFFKSPPDLQSFMPNDFNKGQEWLPHTVDGKQVEYRNYRRGRPISWNYGQYGKYFENIGDQAGVERTARVLSQTWGGFGIGLPLAAMMF